MRISDWSSDVCSSDLWPELVAQVAAVHHALPEVERARTAIYANNYGEAGAINRYGPAYGLPTAISGINSYWARGYGDVPPPTVIVLRDHAGGLADTPAHSPLPPPRPLPPGAQNTTQGPP